MAGSLARFVSPGQAASATVAAVTIAEQLRDRPAVRFDKWDKPEYRDVVKWGAHTSRMGMTR